MMNPEEVIMRLNALERACKIIENIQNNTLVRSFSWRSTKDNIEMIKDCLDDFQVLADEIAKTEEDLHL